jgi:hypothetical protein
VTPIRGVLPFRGLSFSFIDAFRNWANASRQDWLRSVQWAPQSAYSERDGRVLLTLTKFASKELKVRKLRDISSNRAVEGRENAIRKLLSIHGGMSVLTSPNPSSCAEQIYRSSDTVGRSPVHEMELKLGYNSIS